MTAPRAPVLLAVMGLPGAGKTTVARALQARVPGMTRVSRDDLLAASPPPAAYGQRAKAELFAAVLARAAAELRAGRDVVLEGMPFSRASERAAVARTASGAGARALFALVEVPREEARRRLGATAHGPPDRTPGLVDAVAARFDPPAPDVLRLDGTRPAAESAERLLRAIEDA